MVVESSVIHSQLRAQVVRLMFRFWCVIRELPNVTFPVDFVIIAMHCDIMVEFRF